MEQFKIFSNFTEEKIVSWTTDIRIRSSVSLEEKIAIICKAFELNFNYVPNKTQIVDILILSQNNGLLAKISTGEGKSWIVAIIALLKCFEGKKVDVVTSSPILAERDSQNLSKIYSLFGFKSDFVKESSISNEEKVCYSADVLYSDAFNLEVDILRQEFAGEKTRGDRKYEFVIVDEVDSMLIDQSDHSTRLVDRMPSMENLEPVLGLIYLSFKNFIKSCINIENENYVPIKCGEFDKFNEVLIRLIPEEKRCMNGITITTEDQLKCFLIKSCENLEKILDNDRLQIVEYLKSGSVDGSPDFLQELSEIMNFEIDENHRIVDLFIKDRVSLEDYNIPALIAKFLKVKFIIYYNNEGNISISSKYTNYIEEDILTFHILINKDMVFHLKKLDKTNKLMVEIVSKEVNEMIDFSTQCIEKSNNNDNYNRKLKVPFHLKDIVENKLEVWINSALYSTNYKENAHYIKKDDNKIRPIDFDNTGITLENTILSDGIQQFLEIRNSLCITQESFSSNYMSNMTLFRRYINDFDCDNSVVNILGMTGTLGSDSERDMLKALYKVNTINLPTNKMKSNYKLRNLITNDENSWFNAIKDSVLIETRATRTVLLICEHISDIDILIKNFESISEFKDYNIIRYDRSDVSHGIENKIMDEKTIILATNLAGRGTDVKLSDKVIQNGGLHVCITFMPKNSRVQEQAEGRASRQGQPGTSEIIVCRTKSNIVKQFFNKFKDCSEDKLTFDELIKYRDLKEEKRVKKIEINDKPRMEFEEKYFQEYCEIRKNLGERDSRLRNITLAAIDERWAVLLEKNKKHFQNNRDLIEENLKKFFDDINSSLKTNNDKAIKNPSYFIQKGNQYLPHRMNKCTKAIEYYTKAISMEKMFSEFAYYNKAFATLKNGKGKYKEQAVELLTKCGESIVEYIIPNLEAFHTLLNYENINKTKSVTNENDSEFTKQITGKITFYKLVIDSINTAVKEIYQHKEVVVKFETFENFRAKHESNIFKDHEEDLQEMKSKGFIAFILVEKAPPPYWSIVAVIALGTLQIIAGSILTAASLGTLGSGLIGEGVADVFLGLSSLKTGEFSWNEYIMTKGISIAISVVTFSIGKIWKHITKAAKYVGSAISNFASKTWAKIASTSLFKSTSSVITKAKSYLQPIINGVKATAKYIAQKAMAAKVWLDKCYAKAATWVKTCFTYIADKCGLTATKLIFKENCNQVVRSIVKSISQHVIQQGLNIAIDSAVITPIMNTFRPMVEYKVRERICQEFKNTKLRENMDSILRYNNGEKAIYIEIDKLLENETLFMRALKEIAYQVSIKCGQLISKEINIKGLNWWQSSIKTVAAGCLVNSIKMSHSIIKILTIVDKMVEPLNNSLHRINTNGTLKKEIIINENKLAQIKEKIAFKLSKRLSDKVCEILIDGIIKPPVSFSVNTLTHHMFESLSHSNGEEIKAKSNETETTENSQQKNENSPQPVTESITPDSKTSVSNDVKNDLQNELIAQKIERELEVFRVLDDNTLYRYRNYGFSNLESKLDPIRVIEIKKGEYRPITFGCDGTSILDIKYTGNSQSTPSEQSLIESIMASNEDLIKFEKELIESQKKTLREYTFIDTEVNKSIQIQI